MKFLQLNLWQGRLIKNFIQLIKKESPDIINLQEVYAHGPDINSLGLNNLEELQKNLEYKFSYYEPFQTFSFGNSKVSYGLLILSKFEILKKEAIFTNLNYKKKFIYGKDDFNIRCIQHAEIKTLKSILNVYNYHGIWVPNGKMGNNHTESHSHQILDIMEKDQGPKILSGDFNVYPNSNTIKIIEQKYSNLITQYGIKTTRNQFSKRPKEVVDYIFTNKLIKSQSLKASTQLVSDHLALILKFD